MRLIDADALIQRRNHAKRYSPEMYVIGQGYVMDAPTIDAVQVVRCGECRYRELAKVNCKGYTICPASGMEITDDDYCSYGERKEEHHEAD